MREDRPRRERIERDEPLERPVVPALLRVLDVGLGLRDVNMKRHSQLPRDSPRLADGLVADGERCVQPDEPFHAEETAMRE